MEERGFVDALIKTIRTRFPRSSYVRPVDSYTLGVPDILAWIPVDETEWRPWALAIEAKQIKPLMDDPFHRGRRTGLMLKHPFTGPQVSYLRLLHNATVDAFGLVRVSDDTAFRIEPQDIPADTGNFTHEQLIELGKPVRRDDGVWKFWVVDEEGSNVQVLGPGHRGGP